MDAASSALAFLTSVRRVSHHVMEILGLEPGQQCRLIAVRIDVPDIGVYDDVMLAARAWKEIRGAFYVKNMEFCFDEDFETVYCIAFEDAQARFFRGYQVAAGTADFAICKVKRIVIMMDSLQEYIDIPVANKVCVSFCDFLFFHVFSSMT